MKLFCKTNKIDGTEFRQLDIGKEYNVVREYEIKYKKEIIPMVEVEICGGFSNFRREMFEESRTAPVIQPQKEKEYELDGLPF